MNNSVSVPKIVDCNIVLTFLIKIGHQYQLSSNMLVYSYAKDFFQTGTTVRHIATNYEHGYFLPTNNGGKKSKSVAFFYKFCQISTLLLHLVNSSHHGAVGSASAWQTRGRGFEPVLKPYILSGKYPGA